MKLTRRAPKTILIQRIWLKVQESPIPVSVNVRPKVSIHSGERFIIDVSADELIAAIGTEEELNFEFIEEFTKQEEI